MSDPCLLYTSEILDNGIDEHLAGFCTELHLTLKKDGGVVVEDNGRGVPVDLHPAKKIPTVRVVYTILHAGGKFNSDVYKVSGGLHGVGAVSYTHLLRYYISSES